MSGTIYIVVGTIVFVLSTVAFAALEIVYMIRKAEIHRLINQV